MLRARRRHDLGVILFGVLGGLDLTTQQLSKFERLARRSPPATFCTVIVTRPFLMVIRYCIAAYSKSPYNDLDFATRRHGLALDHHPVFVHGLDDLVVRRALGDLLHDLLHVRQVRVPKGSWG